ncbi:MAG: hypothetical protein AB8H79_21685 [Myxococcota bacterium]
MGRWTLLAVCLFGCNGSSTDPGLLIEPGPGAGPGVFDTFADCVTFEPARLIRFTAEEPLQALTLANTCGFAADVEVTFDDPSGVFLLPEGPGYSVEPEAEVTFDIQFDGTPGSHQAQVRTSLVVDGESFPLGPIEMVGTAE